LEKDIRAWVMAWNENPRPFVWIKIAEQILDSLGRLLKRINGAGMTRPMACIAGQGSLRRIGGTVLAGGGLLHLAFTRLRPHVTISPRRMRRLVRRMCDVATVWLAVAEHGGPGMVQLLVVHGVGAAKPESAWMKPLNHRMASMGFQPIVRPVDSVSVPNYAHLFGATDVPEPPETSVRLDGHELLGQRLTYAARQNALERVIRPYAERSNGPDWSWVPRPIIDPIGDLTERFVFEDATRYVSKPAVRHAIWNEVLSSAPRSGGVIVVGHSLGSVVAAGVLRRLPPGVTVDLLITLASPLSFRRYRGHLGSLWSAFPYAHVHRWLNVYSPWDGICAGRGICAEVDEALDVCVRVDGAHDLEAYMSHPAVAAAINAVAFPAENGNDHARSFAGQVARPIHPSWFPLLLGTAFTWQLSKSLPSDQWQRHRRLETAREEVARRAVADIRERRSQRTEFIARLAEQGVSLTKQQQSDHPLADGRYPTFRDLTFRAAAVLNNKWTDDQLLPLAVGLMLQPLVAPFDIQADLKYRQHALMLTLNVVRRSRGNLADQTYAEQVRSSVEWARQRLAEGKGFPWGTVLMASGLAVLAATGVGLAVAAPAGLAGAAVVTSTLAAFGPGGMVGGLLTLGAMTGTAGALGAVGVSMEVGSGGDAAHATDGVQPADTGAELAAVALETMTVTFTGMLAVVHAQLCLDGFKTTERFVREVLSNAGDIVDAELNMHREIAPDANRTNLWQRKRDLVQRAMDALESLNGLPLIDDVRLARRALESGVAPTGPAIPPRPAIEGGS
jgi:hypothetical protein